MSDFANHSTAARLDDLTEVAGHLMTESVIGDQEEPTLATFGNNGTSCTDRLRIGVERPVKAGRRAILVGESRCRRSGGQRDFPLLLGDLLNCQRNRRIRQFGNRTHSVNIKPAPHEGRGHVRLVLMITDGDLDRFSQDLTAYVLDSHTRSIDRGLAAEVRIRAGLVVENPDADSATGALCVCRTIKDQPGTEQANQTHIASSLSELCPYRRRSSARR